MLFYSKSSIIYLIIFLHKLLKIIFLINYFTKTQENVKLGMLIFC